MSDDRLAFPRGELRRRTARGGVVNAVFLGGAEGLVLVQGLIVTALLGPRAIGLYGIVTTTAMTIVALKRVGIDEAFVQQSEEDQEAEFQRAFTLELMLALGFSVVIALLAPVLAAAYGDDRLLLLTLAVAYLPLGFALQAPTWVFFRRMDFVRVRMLQAIVPVVSVLVTLPLVLAGVGVWALVIGPFVGNAVAVAACLAVSPYRLRLRFDRAARRRYLGFSWPIFATAAAVLLVQQGQIFAFDLQGGLAAAGFITLAHTLTRYADRADQIVATTIYPAIVVVRDRLATLEELFVKSNRVTLVWVVPFAAGFVLFAPDLVEFVLGDEWRPAALLLQGLAVAAAVQQLGYNWFSFYRARGDSRPQAVESAVLAVAFLGLAVPALFVWGVEGFLAGRLVTALLVVAVRRAYVRRLLPGVSLAGLAVRAAAPVVLAAVPVLVLRTAVWSGPRSLVQAIAEIVVFLAATGGLTWALERGLFREFAQQLRAGPGTGGGDAATLAGQPVASASA